MNPNETMAPFGTLPGCHTKLTSFPHLIYIHHSLSLGVSATDEADVVVFA